jgi:hypothetical protein
MSISAIPASSKKPPIAAEGGGLSIEMKKEGLDKYLFRG